MQHPAYEAMERYNLHTDETSKDVEISAPDVIEGETNAS